MGKVLIACFSASGNTVGVAKKLAAATGGELYRIRPERPYSAADLDWTNKQSRSSLEMQDPNARPALADLGADVAGAEAVFLGFPVWWYREPSVVDTFLEAYDFSGKTIVPFATSGGSELGEAPQRMQGIVGPGAKVLPGARFPTSVTQEELKAWAEGLEL